MARARSVEVCGAGTRLSPSSLTAPRLREAVRAARARADGARRIAAAFAVAGGPRAGADALEGLAPRLRATG